MEAEMGQNRSTRRLATFRGGLKTVWLGLREQFDRMRCCGAWRQRSTVPQRSGVDLTNRTNLPRASAVIAVTLAMMLTMFMASTPAASGATLPACPVIAKWPVKPVTADVVAALKKYYAARHLTPITIYKNQETVLNVKQQSIGVHWCRNVDGSKSGYVGVVPKNATAAVMVHVKHKPYPVTEAGSTFATLAKMPLTGWKVVSDDTGP